MALSGSTDFSVTGDTLLEDAMREAGIINEDQSATTNQLTHARRQLNMMIKAWQEEGISAWKETEIMIFLTTTAKYYYSLGPSGDNAASTYVETEVATAQSSGESTLVLDTVTGMSNGDAVGIQLDGGDLQWTTINGAPADSTITLTAALTDDVAVDNNVYTYTDLIARPIEIIECRLRDDSDNDIPVEIVSREEYMSIPNKGTTGRTTMVYYQPTLTDGRLYVWPIADNTTRRLVATVRIPVDDIDATANNFDFPVTWLRALKYNLAVELCPSNEREPSKQLLALATESKFHVQYFDTGSNRIRMEFEDTYGY